MILDLFKSKSEPITAFPRCQHRSPAGRQCSQPICSTSPHFCFTHKPKPEELLIAELTEAAGSLSTPEEIHNFLTRVTLLRIQDRLTPKEACGYAYLCQILQRGQREIAFHQKLKDDRAQRAAAQAEEDEVISWSLPRPDRSDPSDSPAQEASPSVPAAPSDATATLVEPSPGSSHVFSKSPPSETDTLVGVSPPAQPIASDATPTSVEVLPPAKPVSAQTSAQIAPSAAKSSESSALSPPRLTPDFYDHFYPIDLTLPPGLQDPRKNIPPPDEAECRRLAARRGLNFNRRRPNSSGVFR